jgi:hypothetical protein
MNAISTRRRVGAVLALAALLAPVATAQLAGQRSQHRAGTKAEVPHYKRDPFAVPGLGATVEQFSLSSDEHLDAVAIRLGGASGRVVAITNDGRGLEANWSAATRISDDTSVARLMNQDSCQVFEDRAYVSWLDDRNGTGTTRVHFNRYDADTASWLAAPIAVNDSAYPSGSDVRDWHMVVERGSAGTPYVVVIVALEAAGQDHVYASVSVNGGDSFQAPFRCHDGTGSPGDVGAVACALRFGELHLAWTDDRAGTQDVYYRAGIMNFVGVPYFFGAPERRISTAAGSEALGRLVLQTGGEFRWTGSDQKYVGLAYLQDDGDGTSNLHVLSSRDNGLNFTDATIFQTATSGTNVAAFDFEIPGDTFVVTWEDDFDLSQQVYRSQSENGLVFDTQVRLSGFEEPSNQGFAPRISPSFGTPHGAAITFLELGTDGAEVFTSFGDQSFGGEWHDEEYPAVSDAQSDATGRGVDSPEVAYNDLYYNYLFGWRQETAPGSGVYELVLGGYRPPFVVLEGWHLGSTASQFRVFHVPFQNTAGFVLVSITPPTSGPGTLLYDGRKTGFLIDGTTNVWLNARWRYAVFINDSSAEGAATAPRPLPPTLTSGATLTFLAVTFGPFGEIETLTEPFTEPFGPPLP